jgi:hypothetical protein
MRRQELERWAVPIVGGVVLLVTLLFIVGAAIRDPRPHDIPVGLSGPPAAIEPLVAAFGQNAPGAFAFTTYESEDAARAAIDDRKVAGALVFGPGGPILVVAGGAGDAITGGIGQAFGNAFAAQGVDLAVETVRPLPAGDAHGIVLFFLVLATAIASVAAGGATVLGGTRPQWLPASVIVATYALTAGVTGTAVAAWLVGGYGDGLWLAMGVSTLLALAVGLVIAAAAGWAGGPGVALTAAIVVLLGLVSSGGPLGSAFLPDAYRAIAPWLPVGPASSAMRGALAFGGVAVLDGAAVLAAWAAVGIIGLVAADHWRRPALEQRRVAVA